MAGDNAEAVDVYTAYASKQLFMEELQDENYNPANLYEIMMRLAATDTDDWSDSGYSTLR